MQDTVATLIRARTWLTRKVRQTHATEDRHRQEQQRAQRLAVETTQQRARTWLASLPNAVRDRRRTHYWSAALAREILRRAHQQRSLKRNREHARRGAPAAVTRSVSGATATRSIPAIARPSKAPTPTCRRPATVRTTPPPAAATQTLRTPRATVAMLSERSRWRKGRTIPDGGWEILFNYGRKHTSDWRCRFHVRPSRALRQLHQQLHADAPGAAPADADDGWGLYAAIDFGPHDYINKYLGVDVGPDRVPGVSDEIMTRLRTEGRDRHVMSIQSPKKGGGKRLIDGLDEICGAQYINAARGINGLRDNAHFGETGTIKPLGNATIHAGTEILMAYGADYWRGVASHTPAAAHDPPPPPTRDARQRQPPEHDEAEQRPPARQKRSRQSTGDDIPRPPPPPTRYAQSALPSPPHSTPLHPRHHHAHTPPPNQQ